MPFVKIPFVFQASAALLVASFIGGQLWLHNAASPSAIVGARASVAGCPKLNQDRQIESQWDVIRAKDSAWVAYIKQAVGISKSCRS